jgi:hypothetical protein
MLLHGTSNFGCGFTSDITRVVAQNISNLRVGGFFNDDGTAGPGRIGGVCENRQNGLGVKQFSGVIQYRATLAVVVDQQSER